MKSGFFFCVFADSGNLFDIMMVLSPVESRYYHIGMGLRLNVEFLDDIEDKFGSDPCRALRKVVSAWLQQEYDVARFGLPTWRTLVEVIDNRAGGNDHQLAEKIALEHPAGE